MIHRGNEQNDRPAKDPKEPAAAAKTPMISDDPMVATDPAGGPQERDNAGGEAETQEGQAPPTAEEQIDILHGQLAELENARLRALAETQNLRKRMERDIAAAHKFAVTGFAADIVPLLDSFQRAIASVSPDDVEKDTALKSLLDGVSMTEKQFLAVLEHHGIKKVEPKDEPFNPHFHQAIAQMQNPDVPAGTVMEVAQPGFVIEDRVIRPAMVVVAQGGAKPVKPPKDSAVTEKPAEPEVSEERETPARPVEPEKAAKPVAPAAEQEPVQPAQETQADQEQQSASAENAGKSKDDAPDQDLDAIAREVIARSRLGGRHRQK